MCEITWGGYMALPPSKHQHCTDEAQKAETVLSAVSYIYIYRYIYTHIHTYIHTYMGHHARSRAKDYRTSLSGP